MALIRDFCKLLLSVPILEAKITPFIQLSQSPNQIITQAAAVELLITFRAELAAWALGSEMVITAHNDDNN